MWTVLLITVASALCVSGDFLMGGHLDNSNVEDKIARTAEEVGELDLLAEESGSSISATVYPDLEPRYNIPYTYAFNGGKPFSLEKDPITGKIDLRKAPPLKALNLSDIYRGDDTEVITDDTEDVDKYYSSYDKLSHHDGKRKNVGPNDINPYNEILNRLPVRYNSDKYQRADYPLISNSYANTKVQSGSNSYNINNHRPTYHQETAAQVNI